MSESPNFWSLYDRLMQDSSLPPEVARLVEASLGGADTFEQALEGTPPATELSDRPPVGQPPRPAGAFLRKVEVERFRGIGPKVVLDLHPGPGLTLVTGRNGSGKSSLAEGLELLLTGDSLRWHQRKPAKEWTSGWRNLHDPGPVQLRASLAVEGHSELVTVARTWSATDDLADGTFAVREGSHPPTDLSALGWIDALVSCRPFLSYNELASALDAGPSKLFDALEGLLGLDDVAEARTRIGEARLAIDRRKRELKKSQDALLAELARLDDPRAEAARAALSAKVPDVDALETLVLQSGEQHGDAELASLRKLATLRAPDTDAVSAIARALREAVEEEHAVAASDTGRALQTAELLKAALRWFESDPQNHCPVCETKGVLGEAWHDAAARRAKQLEKLAIDAQHAQKKLTQAVEQATRLARSTPAPPPSAGLDLTAAQAARDAWTRLPEDPRALADHLEHHRGPLEAAYDTLRDAAIAALDTLQLAWRPLERRLGDWANDARRVELDASQRKDLAAAEDWLKVAEGELRDEAFTPIADKAQQTWGLLRQQSNVDLGRPKLAGTSTRRRVELNITVDGTEGIALGVMSQGELHALALSLFLPRLTRPDSPFRFVVVDDPVQAMDPAKVDGLAQVLHGAAKTHQVVVFTHDARLPAAVRRLGIPARILEVARHPDSRVELRQAGDPVEQHLSDAFHLNDQGKALGFDLVRTVVPGLCRAAVEAALTDRIWATQLEKGTPHHDIEAALADIQGLTPLCAYAWWGDAQRGADVLPRLNKLGAWAADTFQELKRHAHEPLPSGTDVRSFILDARRLAKELGL